MPLPSIMSDPITRLGVLGPVAVILVACATATTNAPSSQDRASLRVRDAPDAIADALRSHSLVLLSEHHWSVAVHEQLRRIVTSPKLDGLVQDIVVEFGNPLYQSLIDRYVHGESVPIDSVRLAWRNTTQLLAWDSPLYERFYETVRTVNATRPHERRLRIVAGDPPIDWSRTNRAEDIPRSFGFRDIETIGIIEREVLAKGRRALVIIGEEHVLRSTGPMPDGRAKPLERMSLGEALDARHPGVGFLVATVAGDASPLARTIRTWPNGSMASIAETEIGLADASIRERGSALQKVEPAGPGKPRLQDLFDAVLYAGPVTQVLEPPPVVYRADPEYEQEIRRRIKILERFYGVDIWTEDLDRLLRTPQ